MVPEIQVFYPIYVIARRAQPDVAISQHRVSFRRLPRSLCSLALQDRLRRSTSEPSGSSSTSYASLRSHKYSPEPASQVLVA
jgi:hypothetical protein